MQRKQRAAQGFAACFAPRSRLGLWLRNQVMHLMGMRLIADWAMGGLMRGRLVLPGYD
jgi:hypothetical protein